MLITILSLLTVVARPAAAAPPAPAPNPFTNEGTAAEPPRARLKPQAVRVRITEADCRRLLAHRPAPDVAYRPGVDVRGRAVAPADLPGSTDLADRLLETEVAFDLLLNPILFAGNPRLAAWFENATVDFGRVVFDPETGETTLDGETLSDPQAAALAKACAERLRADER
ncbi:MAG: hypothetical protein NXI21_16945 [Alphaproteobacteria bacterium]|nr:hypothetical protein [Alphaproteobacteria bacterium]